MIDIIALHGFLGRPRDFTPLTLVGLLAPDIFRTALCPMEQWARRFNRSLSKRSVILGYSMGGRLALHSLLDDEKKFSAAIIICAHPGLRTDRERYSRLITDQLWAKKFADMPWDKLIAEWNCSPIFKGSKAAPRYERDFDRQALKRAMRYFSLGQQKDLLPLIKRSKVPILWLTPKQEVQTIKCIEFSHPLSQVIELANSGHRLLLEHPRSLGAIITSFLREVKKIS